MNSVQHKLSKFDHSNEKRGCEKGSVNKTNFFKRGHGSHKNNLQTTMPFNRIKFQTHSLLSGRKTHRRKCFVRSFEIRNSFFEPKR